MIIWGGGGLVPGAAELSQWAVGSLEAPGYYLKSRSLHPGILTAFEVLRVTPVFPWRALLLHLSSGALGLLLFSVVG